MNVREVLTEVLQQAGSAPVETKLRPAEVAARARRRRRQALAVRSVVAAAGAGVVVLIAVMAATAMVQQPAQQPPPIAHSSRPANTASDPAVPPPPSGPSAGKTGQPGQQADPPGSEHQGSPSERQAQPPGGERPGTPDDQQPDDQQPDEPGNEQGRQPTTPRSESRVPTGPPIPENSQGASILGEGRICGEVMVDGATLSVEVAQGDVSCEQASHVIRQALTTKPDTPSQGNRGISDPSGWECRAGGPDLPSAAGISCTKDESVIVARQTGQPQETESEQPEQSESPEHGQPKQSDQPETDQPENGFSSSGGLLSTRAPARTQQRTTR